MDPIRARRRRGGGLPLLLSLAWMALVPAPAAVALEPAAALVPSGATAANSTEIWDPQLLRQAGLDPDRLHCNARVSWLSGLREQVAELVDQIQGQLPSGALQNAEQRRHFREATAELLFWRLVRVTIVDTDNHNAGVIRLRGFQWRDASGVSHPLLVFRSAITRIDPSAPSCVGSLLRDGGVRHVVNLYDADRIPIGSLQQQEESLSRSCGASYLAPQQAVARYGYWRERLRPVSTGSPADPVAMGDLARLIREQILAPGGRPPQGNIYLHCGGGMHRSGMVMGILDRCVNGASMEEVRRRYLWHTGWQSPEQPGGAEPGNLAVIAAFDCRSLGALPERRNLGAPPGP